jgi:ABC-type molybdate transport system substrate-binding protein
MAQTNLMRALLVTIVIAVTSSASAADIKIMAAGSLKDVFTAIFADFTKQYGGSFAPVYGPSGGLRERLEKGEAFDVFASAALPHAQALTDANISGPSIMFTRNALCVVTEASRPLEPNNLVETLLKPEIRFGTSTPISDPAGDYTWEMFHKIDALKPGAFGTLSQKALQLFGGPTTTALVNGRPRPLVALDNHDVDLFIYYCSGAQQIVRESGKYKSVALPHELFVGPEYGLTLSRKAQPAAVDFAMYLMSPRGQATLKSFGLIPVALPAAQ